MMDIEKLIKKAQIEHFENQDFIEAEKLYLIAAKLGSGHAAHELGVLYITGGPGVQPNYKESQFWLEKSQELGFESTIATDPEWFRKQK